MTPFTKHHNRQLMRYFSMDGLIEITLGLLVLCWSSILLFVPPTHALWPFVLSLVGMNIGMRTGIRYIQDRLTYPRLGYARAMLRPDQHYRLMLTIAIIGGLGALVVHVYRASGTESFSLDTLLSYAVTLISSLIWIWAGYSMQVTRFSILGIAMLVLPLMLSLLQLPGTTLATVMVGQAVLLILSGAWALLHLLQLPLLQTERDDDDA